MITLTLTLLSKGFFGALGYLCGSCPFGLWIPKFLGRGDPRGVGSGNIGTTNVYRLAGVKISLAVLLCDVLKGMIPVWIAPPPHRLFVGACCVLGHVFPLFLGFRGGKGIATFCGVLAVVAPTCLLISLGVALLLRQRSPYMSVASLGGVLTNLVLSLHDGAYALFSLLLTGLILYTHRENLGRLYQGNEFSLGGKGERSRKG